MFLSSTFLRVPTIFYLNFLLFSIVLIPIQIYLIDRLLIFHCDLKITFLKTLSSQLWRLCCVWLFGLRVIDWLNILLLFCLWAWQLTVHRFQSYVRQILNQVALTQIALRFLSRMSWCDIIYYVYLILYHDLCVVFAHTLIMNFITIASYCTFHLLILTNIVSRTSVRVAMVNCTWTLSCS